jgi:hypothetical protein
LLLDMLAHRYTWAEFDTGEAGSLMNLYGTPVGAKAAGAFEMRLADLSTQLSWPRTIPNMIHESEQGQLHDHAVIAPAGRWQLGTEDPEEFVAGDVVYLRALLTSGLVTAARNLVGRREMLGAFSCMWPDVLLRRAQNYFVPVEAVKAVVSAEEPDADLLDHLVLPAPVVVVVFGREIPIDPADVLMPAALLDQLNTFEEAPDWRTSPWGNLTVERHGAYHGGRVTGVLLMADRRGRLADEVHWLISADPNPEAPYPINLDRVRGIVRGWRTHSTMGRLASIAAATVAWGGWHPPVPRLFGSDADERTIRRAVATSSGRRREAAGAMGAVRILDVHATVPSREPGAPGRGGHHLSPIPHFRRPHPRRTRVGPRDNWHYEVREIGGSRVAPHGPVRSGEIVWRLPKPD